MEDLLATLLALALAAGTAALLALPLLLPLVAFAVIAVVAIVVYRRVNTPHAEDKLPEPLQEFVELGPRHLKGLDPQHEAWEAAAHALGFQREERPETWTDFGSSVLSGTLDGRAVRVWVRAHGTLRFTVVDVVVGEGFVPPADLPEQLRAHTRQGAHGRPQAPRLAVEGDLLRHEATGIRSDPEALAATVRAVVKIASPGAAPSDPPH